MNFLSKKSPTTTNNTSFLSMMTPHVNNNDENNRRRQSSAGEDSGVQFDHDSASKSVHSPLATFPNPLYSLSSLTYPKTIGTTTAPNPHSNTSCTSDLTMVTSSTLIPPSVDVKPSSTVRKDSNASSSGAFSEVSRSFGYEENSSDSFYGLTSSSSAAASAPSPSAHYIIKCNLNPTPNSNTSTLACSLTPTPSPPSSTMLTPRVKVTLEQPTASAMCSSRSNTTSESIPISSFLQTPIASSIVMNTSTASSAPEFSVSGTSSIDDSDEIALYEHYLSISHARQSNPSPEIRKKLFDEVFRLDHRPLPRSKSEVHTHPMEQMQHHHQQQQQQQQQQLHQQSSQSPASSSLPSSQTSPKTSLTSEIKSEATSYVSEDDESHHRVSASNTSANTDMTKKKKSKAATIAKDFRVRAVNLIRRRTTEATLSEKSLIPSREDVQSWEESFDALLRHRYGQALFRAFLRTEFSEENLEFWLACDEFRNCKEPKRSTKAKKIYMDFIAIGAPKQVNLDTETRMSTIANIDNPPLETFDRAQRRIQGLMEKDPYQRFLKSELYINLLRRTTYPVQRRTTNEMPSKSSS